MPTNPARCFLRSLALAGALALLPVGAAFAQAQLPLGFQDQGIVDQLDWPGSLAFLPDGRLLVAEIKTAQIRMIVEGSLAGVDPTGTIDSVRTAEEERGLLGLAVDPRWPVKPFLYVLYTALDTTVHVSRFTAQGDLSDGTSGNLALVPGSRRELIRDIRDKYENHNGGTLRFGPDSMLYVSLADDADGCTAADTTRLSGVILRLDVRNLPVGGGPPDKALITPADNPYASRPNANQRLMWTRGVRNPFRFTFDAPTGRMFVADVGFQKYEEVDIVDTPAQHLGWPYYEGTSLLVTAECGPLAPAGLTPPIIEYDRVEYCPGPCASAIIGGVVLRHVPNSSVSFPLEYDGQYFFSDYYDGFAWRYRDSLGTWVRAPVAPGQPNSRDWARNLRQASEYVLGPDGAVYYALNATDFQNNTGQVRRIIHPNGSTSVAGGAKAEVVLASVYPSPAHGSATLRYVLPHAANVRLTLYDALGRRVRELVPSRQDAAGDHRVHWDGADAGGRPAAPGVYLARLVVDGRVYDRRIPLTR